MEEPDRSQHLADIVGDVGAFVGDVSDVVGDVGDVVDVQKSKREFR